MFKRDGWLRIGLNGFDEIVDKALACTHAIWNEACLILLVTGVAVSQSLFNVEYALAADDLHGTVGGKLRLGRGTANKQCTNTATFKGQTQQCHVFNTMLFVTLVKHGIHSCEHMRDIAAKEFEHRQDAIGAEVG